MKMNALIPFFLFALALSPAASSANPPRAHVPAQQQGLNAEGIPVSEAEIPGVASVTFLNAGKYRLILIKDRKGRVIATDRHEADESSLIAAQGVQDGLVLLHTGSDGSAVWGVYSQGVMVGLLIRQSDGELSYSSLQ